MQSESSCSELLRDNAPGFGSELDTYRRAVRGDIDIDVAWLGDRQSECRWLSFVRLPLLRPHRCGALCEYIWYRQQRNQRKRKSGYHCVSRVLSFHCCHVGLPEVSMNQSMRRSSRFERPRAG
jgi:hypothetical protein